MKKLSFVLFIASMFFSTNVFAQEQGDMAIGGNLIMAGDKTKLYGVGAKFQYNMFSKIRLDGSFSFFLPKKEKHEFPGGSIETTLGMWNFSANVHWLIGRNNFKFYPLAGFGIAGLSAKVSAMGESDSANESYRGFNLGAGIEYILSETLAINFEYRELIVNSGTMMHAMLGLSYKLNSGY